MLTVIGFAERDPADGAVAAVPSAGAAAAAADAELLDEHGIAPFEDFRVGEPGVGHVGLHRGRAVESRSRARAGGDGLVVLVPSLPKVRLFMVPEPSA